MQITEKISTNVKTSIVGSYLTNFYRSQDYRTVVEDNKITVIPYSILHPFVSREKAATIHSMTYIFNTTGENTEISFICTIAFKRKVLGLVLPIATFGLIYVLLKMLLGVEIMMSLILLIVLVASLVSYSYFQTKNFVTHITDKNKKLLAEMELFASIDSSCGFSHTEKI